MSNMSEGIYKINSIFTVLELNSQQLHVKIY